MATIGKIYGYKSHAKVSRVRIRELASWSSAVKTDTVYPSLSL